MNLFPSYVHVNDFTGTYSQVEYGNPNWSGYCHLKIDAHKGRLLVLCSEMNGFRGRSLYHGGDLEMRRVVLDLLIDDAVLVSTRPKFLFDHFYRKQFRQKQWKDVLDHFNKTVIYIRYHPDACSKYILVERPLGLACTVSMNRDHLINVYGISRSFLDVPDSVLKYVPPDTEASVEPDSAPPSLPVVTGFKALSLQRDVAG
jgi:hypothetical protein